MSDVITSGTIEINITKRDGKEIVGFIHDVNPRLEENDLGIFAGEESGVVVLDENENIIGTTTVIVETDNTDHEFDPGDDIGIAREDETPTYTYKTDVSVSGVVLNDDTEVVASVETHDITAVETYTRDEHDNKYSNNEVDD
jgi:hypothetical protein